MSLSLMLVLAGCGAEAPAPAPTAAPAPPTDPKAELAKRAGAVFGKLPEAAWKDGAPPAPELVALGRALYHDPRLSVNEQISCNSCHDLARAGVDNEPTSLGHAGERGGRNSPTVLNAALHVAQFWDGRAADVEEQAKGPILNPVEMGMPDGASVEKKLRAIAGYRPMFAAAFPNVEEPVTFDHCATAIAAFERGLVTPAPFDAFVAGDTSALTDQQLEGLRTFMDVGCVSCHMGPAVGGSTYQTLGLVRPFDTKDEGRFAVTKDDADKHVFKVPSLRNVTKTGPWFHDGHVTSLDQAVRLMGAHQLGKDLSDAEVASIVAFLGSLEGTLPPEVVAAPTLP